MRPDPDSDLAGAESEYGDDTGFAAEATRTSDPDSGPASSDAREETNSTDDTAGLTTEDDDAADLGTGGD
jgi:hypothetical protein